MVLCYSSHRKLIQPLFTFSASLRLAQAHIHDFPSSSYHLESWRHFIAPVASLSHPQNRCKQTAQNVILWHLPQVRAAANLQQSAFPDTLGLLKAAALGMLGPAGPCLSCTFPGGAPSSATHPWRLGRPGPLAPWR